MSQSRLTKAGLNPELKYDYGDEKIYRAQSSIHPGLSWEIRQFDDGRTDATTFWESGVFNCKSGEDAGRIANAFAEFAGWMETQ